MSKAKTIDASSEYLALVEKSGLLAGEQLEQVRHICAANEGAKSAARELLKHRLLTPWQATQLLSGFTMFWFSKYTLVDQITKGEFRRVYKAQHGETGQQVAVEVLTDKGRADSKRVERFLADARAAATLDHPNIVRVLEVVSDQARPYLVTEFVAGGNLQQWVETNGPVAPRVAADLVTQIAEAMTYLHGLNTLHGDLKPANLFIDDPPSADRPCTVKVLAVGAGQTLPIDKASTEATGELLLSTLGFQSPEQARGKDLNACSDIYALGGVLYYLLTGRAAYTAATSEELEAIRKTKRPIPVTALRADVPAAVAALCDQMMALRAADRPGSMADVAQRLRPFLSGTEVLSGTEIPPDMAILSSTQSTTATNVLAGAACGFRIQKKKKSEIVETLAATPLESTEPALAAVAKKVRRQRTMLIGTSAVSLLAIVVSLVFLVLTSGGDATRTATGTTASPVAEAAPATAVLAAGQLDPNDPENLPDPASAPETAAVVEPAPQPQLVTTMSSPAPTASTPPASLAPPPAPVEKEEPKPAAPPAPKWGYTFEMARAVDLPRLPSRDGSSPAEPPAKVLGKVNIGSADDCFIALQGGNKAVKGRSAIAIRNAQGGTARRAWELVQPDSSGSESVIATLALPAQELQFEWTPDGLKNLHAGGLQNCVLKITAGQEKPHIVALRTAMLAPPMTIENLERGNLSARFNLVDVPDSSALRMESTVLNQKTIFDDGGPGLTKAVQWIYFGESKEKAPLALKLDTSVNPKGIQISALPFVQLPGEKPQKLTPALRKKLSLAELQQKAAAVAEQLRVMQKLAQADQNKSPNEVALIQFSRDLEKRIQLVTKLDELINQLNNGGTIHFRIYYDTGESPVELVRTYEQLPPAGK